MKDEFGPVASVHGQAAGRYSIVLAREGQATPLDAAMRRAMRFAGDPSRVLVSTTRGGTAQAARWPGVRWVEQPRDRDTTPGLLLPLLQVLDRDPWAWVAVLPSDGEITDEEELADALGQGMDELEAVGVERLVLVDAAPVALGRGSSIARLIRRCAPDWWTALTNSFFRPADLDAVYSRMPPSSFSRMVRDPRPS